jgi:hypothetical protein
MDVADSLTRSGMSPPNLDRSIEDRRPSAIAYISPGWAARRRSFPAAADHGQAPHGDTLPKSCTWDYLRDPNDLANITVVLVPRIEASQSPATAAPERGAFTDFDEEFPRTWCTTSQLLPRAASSRTAQTSDDRIRAWVALPAAIYGGGWSPCGARWHSCERCSSGSGKMGCKGGMVKGVLMGTILGRSWTRQLRGLQRGGYGRPTCAWWWEVGTARWATRVSDTGAAEPCTHDESGIGPAGQRLAAQFVASLLFSFLFLFCLPFILNSKFEFESFYEFHLWVKCTHSNPSIKMIYFLYFLYFLYLCLFT